MPSQRSVGANSQDYEFLFKIIIAGDISCGKSKILQRFCYDTFDTPTKATIGVEFVSKVVEINEGETRIRL